MILIDVPFTDGNYTHGVQPSYCSACYPAFYSLRQSGITFDEGNHSSYIYIN